MIELILEMDWIGYRLESLDWIIRIELKYKYKKITIGIMVMLNTLDIMIPNEMPEMEYYQSRLTFGHQNKIKKILHVYWLIFVCYICDKFVIIYFIVFKMNLNHWVLSWVQGSKEINNLCKDSNS